MDPELSIDLGAIAKGYTAQLAKEALNKVGLKNGYINAGGNVVLLGEKEDGSNWKIGIQSPDSNDALVQYATKKATCLVTSGDYQRYFTYKNKKYSHIIDPTNRLSCKLCSKCNRHHKRLRQGRCLKHNFILYECQKMERNIYLPLIMMYKPYGSWIKIADVTADLRNERL